MASDCFLKLEGVPGESVVQGHVGEIEIDSFAWAQANIAKRVASTGNAPGKVSMQDFHFVARTSKASPLLFLRCATGTHIKEAKLTVRKAGEQPLEYYIVTLTDVLITGYGVTGAGAADPPAGDTEPRDQFSLNFNKIVFEYKPQKADGTLDAAVKAGYDLKANKKI